MYDDARTRCVVSTYQEIPMKDKINILFVCGYGVGSSVMLKIVVEKALKKLNINAEMEHTAAGEASGYINWVDIVAISKKLVNVIDLGAFKNKHIIQIENLMDGEKIGAQINDLVEKHVKEAKGGGQQ